jgi:hypothetical protein
MILPFQQAYPNGKPNHFVPKIWASYLNGAVSSKNAVGTYMEMYAHRFGNLPPIDNVAPKHHTIRADEKGLWAAGVNIHPVINNRTRNRFQFAPTAVCTSTQNIFIYRTDVSVDRRVLSPGEVERLAINDGFESVEGFFSHFNATFSGKIIHWTDLEY